MTVMNFINETACRLDWRIVTMMPTFPSSNSVWDNRL